MRRGSALVVAVVAAVGLGAGLAPAETTQAIGQGRLLVAERCGKCHATTAGGLSTHEDAPAFRAIVHSYPPEHLAESLAEGLTVGHPDMPEFEFDEVEIAAIIAYLKSLQ